MERQDFGIFLLQDGDQIMQQSNVSAEWYGHTELEQMCQMCNNIASFMAFQI